MGQNVTHAIELLHSLRPFVFSSTEKDFHQHILENIHDIAKDAGWGDVLRCENEFRIPCIGGYAVVDIMVWHTDGSGTIIECKKSHKDRTSELAGIGQLLFYGQKAEDALGHKPRLVYAHTELNLDILRLVSEYKLPIRCMEVCGDRVIII